METKYKLRKINGKYKLPNIRLKLNSDNIVYKLKAIYLECSNHAQPHNLSIYANQNTIDMWILWLIKNTGYTPIADMIPPFMGIPFIIFDIEDDKIIMCHINISIDMIKEFLEKPKVAEQLNYI